MPEGRRDGRSFEDEVASHFKAHGYQVKRRTKSAGQEDDLLCLRKEMGFERRILVECKDHKRRAGSLDIDKFCSRAERMLGRREITDAMMISRSGFVRSGLASRLTADTTNGAIQLLDYHDFLIQTVDFDYYLDRVIWDFENLTDFMSDEPAGEPLVRQFLRDDLYSRYIELPAVQLQRTGEEEEVKLTSLLREALVRKGEQCILLGEIGSGKTSVSLHLTYVMAKSYRDPSSTAAKRIPIYISLGGAAKYQDFFEFLWRSLEHLKIRFGSAAELRRVLPLLPVVMILDGFDEMTPSNSPQAIGEMAELIRPLLRLRIPVLLTCRSHFFASTDTAVNLFSGVAPDGVLPHILKLSALSPELIRGYIEQLRPDTWKDDYELIQEVFDLPDLSKRPLLLRMIIDHLDKLHLDRTASQRTAIPVGPTELYGTYTQEWTGTAVSRGQFSPDTRKAVALQLARFVWLSSEPFVDGHSLLRQVLSSREVGHVSEDDLAKLRYNVTTCSFMIRVGDGLYSFSHKSFAEYFVAELMAQELESGDFSLLLEKRIDRGVSMFMRDLVKPQHYESLLRLMEANTSAARITAHHLYRQLVRLGSIEPELEFQSKLRRFLAAESDPLAGSEIAVTLARLGDLHSQDEYLAGLFNNQPDALDAIVQTNIIEYYDATGSVTDSFKSRIPDPKYEYARVWYFLGFAMVGSVEDVEFLKNAVIPNLRPFERKVISYAVDRIENRS